MGTIDQALQGVVAVKHFFVRRFGLAGKVVIFDEIHSYDVYTGTLDHPLIRELVDLRCSVIVLSHSNGGAAQGTSQGRQCESRTELRPSPTRTRW